MSDKRIVSYIKVETIEKTEQDQLKTHLLFTNRQENGLAQEIYDAMPVIQKIHNDNPRNITDGYDIGADLFLIIPNTNLKCENYAKRNIIDAQNYVNRAKKTGLLVGVIMTIN